MEREAHPTLEAITDALADGTPIDWEGLREALPELASELDALREVERVMAAHRAAIEGSKPPAS